MKKGENMEKTREFKTGVFPVYDMDFAIGIKGENSVESDMKVIKEMDNFSMSIASDSQEWYPMDAKGWRKLLVTAKALTISLAGKRCYGDEGNDYVASVALKNGRSCNSKLKITFSNGDTLEMDCVLKITNWVGGASTDVQPLEFDLESNGEPIFTASPTE